MVKRAVALLAALVAGFGLVSLVSADGEAGVVIDYGGTIRTECVAFEGDSITGEELLRAAGSSFVQFGGGARAVCSLDGVGCDDASSFESCFCECESGACTYWAFFIQRYGGSWQYSTVGFNLAVVRDGDLHGWKWGSGSMQSAPPPAGTTFENVCGHSPNGGNPPTPTPTATATPTNTPQPPPSPTPTTPGGPSAIATATVTGAGTTSPSAAATESPTLTPPATTASPASSPSPAATRETPAPVTVTMTASASDTDGDEGGGGGSSAAALAGFGLVAAALVGGIAIVAMRRRRHGD